MTFVQRNSEFSCSETSLPKVSACESDNRTWSSKCFWLSARYFEMPAANTSLHDKSFPLTPLEQSVSLSTKLLVTGRSLEVLKCKTSSARCLWAITGYFCSCTSLQLSASVWKWENSPICEEEVTFIPLKLACNHCFSLTTVTMLSATKKHLNSTLSL